MQDINNQNFTLEEARVEFVKIRDRLEQIVKKSPAKFLDSIYGEEFGRIYTKATLGDIVAQDFLGYIFKRGRQGLVPENIDLSMKWLILAAANGNPLSLERLAIFLNYAYDEITNHPDFQIMQMENDINENNYALIIGKAVCEAIVDELKIDALEIIKEIPSELFFNSKSMNIYDRARNNVIDLVAQYLKGQNPHNNSRKKTTPSEEIKISKGFSIFRNEKKK